MFIHQFFYDFANFKRSLKRRKLGFLTEKEMFDMFCEFKNLEQQSQLVDEVKWMRDDLGVRLDSINSKLSRVAGFCKAV